MKKQRIWRKSICILVTIVLVISYLPLNVLAAGLPDNSDNSGSTANPMIGMGQASDVKPDVTFPDPDTGAELEAISGPFGNVPGKAKVVRMMEMHEQTDKAYGSYIVPETVKNDDKTYQVMEVANDAFKDITNIKNIVIPNGISVIPGGLLDKLKDATVYCNVGSAAQKAVTDKGIKCVTDALAVASPANQVAVGDKTFFDIAKWPEFVDGHCDTTWSSSDDNLIAIDSKTGDVEAKKEGKVQVTASVDGLNATVDVEVVNQEAVLQTQEDIPTHGTCGENLTWNLSSDDRTLTISGTGKMTDFQNQTNQPWYSSDSEIKIIKLGDGVTTIGSYAFENCRNLTDVIIPGSVITIGKDAFAACNSLASVAIPGNVTTIGDSAFMLTSLTNITIPNSVTTIGEYAFSSLDNLTDMRIESGSIGKGAFKDCSKLKNTILGNDVMSIGENAFENCTNLENVEIPSSVTTIGASAFSSCTSLTNMTIPGSVTTIGSNAFSNCTNLTKATIMNGVKTTIGVMAFLNCSNLTNVTISDTVISIGGSAFYNCIKLTNVIIPGGVTTIGSYAFKGCIDLTNVTISNGVESIGDWAFYECQNLSSVTIPNSMVSVGYCAFGGCDNLTSATIESGSIGTYAFESCCMKNLLLGNGVTKIGEEAFCDNNLTSLMIPSSVISIGKAAFSHSKVLSSVIIQNGVSGIEESAFSDCKSLVNIVIPSSITSIGRSAFTGCTSLPSVVIPGSITSIGTSAFAGCTSMTNLTIQNGVGNIGSYAFMNCDSLPSVNIPGSVTNIGEAAFDDCNNLKMIIILSKNTSFGGTFCSFCPSTMVMKGYANSTVETYAKEQKIKFEIIDDRTNPTPYSKCDYNLTVLDGTMNTPIDSATVTFQGKNYTTNENGNVTLTAEDADGMTVVKASKTGYTDNSLFLRELNAYGQNSISLTPQGGTVSSTPFNLNLGSTTVDGPTVDIGDWSFPIFQADNSVDLGQFTYKQKVDAVSKTVYQAFGVDESVADKEGDAYWKGTYQNLKTLAAPFKKESDKEFYNNFRANRKFLKEHNMSIGVGCSGSAFGYCEYSYATGKMEFKEGGLTVVVSSSFDYKYRIPETAGLAYVRFKLTGTIGGKFYLTVADTNIKDPKIIAQISASLDAQLALGVGDSRILSLEGGIDGSLNTTVTLDNKKENTLADSLLVKLNAKVFVNAAIFGFDAVAWEHSFLDTQIYPKNESLSTASVQLRDFDNYKPIKRDYLNNSGITTAGSASTYSQKSVYPYGTPKIVKLEDGRLMAFWIADDGTKSDVNRTTFMYAIRMTSGMWSEAKAVYESGRADYNPQVAVMGNNCYVLWNNASEVYPDGTSLTETLKKMNLVFSTFDGSNFSTPTVISNQNEKMQMLPSVDVQDGNVTISWLENSANNPYMSEGTNTLFKRTVNNGSLSGVQTVTTDIGYLNGMVNYHGDIYYSKDKDGNPTTKNDSEIYKITNTGIITAITDDNVDDLCIKNIDDTLYWLRDGKLVTSDGSNVNEMGIACFSDYDVLNIGDQQTVLTTEKNGFKSEIYIASRNGNDGSWSVSVPATHYGGYIRKFDAVADASGNIVTALDNVTIKDDYSGSGSPYGSTDFIISGMEDRYDLAVDSTLYYNPAEVKAGNTIALTASVTNNSTQPVSKLKVTQLNDAGDTIKSEIVNQTIGVGQTADVVTQYALPSTLSYQTVSVKVEAVDVTEEQNDNNTATARFGFCNMAISKATLIKNSDGSGTITATVNNNGFITADNIKLILYQNGTSGTELGVKTIGSMLNGISQTVSFNIPKEQLISTSNYDGKLFYLKVETDSEESDYSDNSNEVLVNPVVATAITLDKANLSLNINDIVKLNATLTPSDAASDIQWASDNTAAVKVDDTGRLKAVGAGTATITAMIGDKIAKCSVTVTSTISPVVTSITVNALPSKTVYSVGDTLDTLGGKVIVVLSDGTTKTIDLSSDMCSGYDPNTLGEQTVKVVYNGCETSFKVTVQVPVSPSSDFNYLMTDDGNGIAITHYKGTSKYVSIPSSIDGKPVTQIVGYYSKTTDDNGIFDTAVDYVQIPSTVTKINGYALSNCKKIVADGENSSYKTVDGILFSKDGRVLVSYPKARGDTVYTVPQDVTEIGDFAFYFMKTLQQISIPDGVKKIGSFAFRGTSLTSITLNAAEIGDDSFGNCSNLTKITFTDNVKKINGSAFTCTAITELTLPDSIYSLGSECFSSCVDLKSVRMPKKLTDIQGCASRTFMDCTSLSNVEFPEGAEYLDLYNSFAGCNSLKSIDMSMVASMDGYGDTFINCKNIKRLELPKKVGTFFELTGMDALRELKIPDNTVVATRGTNNYVTTVISAANLEKLYIPASFTSMTDRNGIKGTISPVCTKVTIYGESGSYAEQYAQKNSIPFIAGTIKINVTKLALNKISLILKTNMTEKLNVMFSPDDATNKSVTWSSSDNSVATVDNNGIVSGLKNGTTTIICTANDGSNVKVICSVKVQSPYLLGDINNDTNINASDALQALRHSVKEITLEGDEFIRGDVTKDGVINASDALQILRYSVKEIDHFRE